MKRLSIVIPNFNYGHFIDQAVRSALELDWPDKEIVVVDDGSTDDSMTVLQQYRERVLVLRQENSGPRVACNLGFEHTSGDAVLFLDSDDVVEPRLAREVARVWRPGVSKVQVQMVRIGPSGEEQDIFPSFRRVPSPDQIRNWAERTGAYPTPPGSGNVYSRDFLERLFPIGDDCGDATDSACLAAAPFLGEVVTIATPLVRYRVHGNNRSSLRRDPSRLSSQIDRAFRRHMFATGAARGMSNDTAVVTQVVRRGRHLLQMRVAESRLGRGRPTLPGDNRRLMAWDAVKQIAEPGPENLLTRIIVSGWCLAVLAAPRSLAQVAVRGRFR